jgi:hypothetical protein
MTLIDPSEREFASPPAPPRTLKVLLVVVVAALMVSWIGAYAVTNALVAAEVMSPWQPGHDPRPQRMGVLFATLLAAFTAAALLFRWMSVRQLRRLDDMANAEDRPLIDDN